MSIKPLPENTKAQISSAVQINSLEDVIEGLFTNSLDAKADRVTISVDLAKGFCSVEDDGFGIPSTEFGENGLLAQLHCTSKHRNESTYGRNGRFLFCLSSLSLLSITSRQRNETSSSTLLLHRSQVLSRRVMRDEEEDTRFCGTVVKVHNLFGDIPVRFKQQHLRCTDPLETEKQFETIKTRLVGYLIAYPRAIKLRLATTDQRHSWTNRPSKVLGKTSETFSITRIESTLRQSRLLSDNFGQWRLASIKAGDISVRAAFCLMPAPSKRCQFVSIGMRPVHCKRFGELFYDHINRAFEASRFGSIDSASDSNTEKSPGKSRGGGLSYSLRQNLVKGVDKWPCFYLRIDSKRNIESMRDMDENRRDAEISTSVRDILNLIDALIQHFLNKHQLSHKSQPRRQISIPTERRQCTSPKAATPTWSSARTSGLSAREVLEALPFSANSRIIIPSYEQDFKLLIDDIDLNDMQLDGAPATSSSSEPATSMASLGEVADTKLDYDDVAWKEPTTGNIVHLDPANGFALPHWNDRRASEPDHSSGRAIERSDSCFGPAKTPTSSAVLAERLKALPKPTYASKLEPEIQSLVVDESLHSAQQIVSCEHSIDASRLTEAKVLGQVDSKFILAQIPGSDRDSEPTSHLIMLDQHAADERIKVEELYKDLCKGIATTLHPPLVFDIAANESRRFAQLRPYFETWAIHYNIETISSLLTVTHLPQLIAERCRLDPKLLIELLRREIWSDQPQRCPTATEPWPTRITSCPTGLVEMIKSRACRTAIMFNDKLSHDQCTILVKRLSTCISPFRCAHGRTNITLLPNIETLDIGHHWSTSDNDRTSFGNAFRDWTT